MVIYEPGNGKSMKLLIITSRSILYCRTKMSWQMAARCEERRKTNSRESQANEGIEDNSLKTAEGSILLVKHIREDAEACRTYRDRLITVPGTAKTWPLRSLHEA